MNFPMAQLKDPLLRMSFVILSIFHAFSVIRDLKKEESYFHAMQNSKSRR